MILGRFFLETRSTEKNPMGEARSLEIDWYDPVNRNFPGSIYESGGGVLSGIGIFSGNTNSRDVKIRRRGKAVSGRGYRHTCGRFDEVGKAESLATAKRGHLSTRASLPRPSPLRRSSLRSETLAIRKSKNQGGSSSNGSAVCCSF